MGIDIKKPLDRITEAYIGSMGEDFSKKTRDRINWIVNHVQGTKVLDIGCSQGIVPIILGREGKQVDAIDIAEESINYAIIDLKNEHLTVQENVKFRISNFMTDMELSESYETILLTEVLEHISDPHSFLNKINNHLNMEGRLVVTVPFGINDYFDHKRTYYFLDLFKQLSQFFIIEKFEYLGKWVGVICKKSTETKISYKNDSFNADIIVNLEKAFYVVERELLTRIEGFQKSVREKNEYINKLQEQHSNYIKKYEDKILQREDKIKSLNLRINEINALNNTMFEEVREEKSTNRRLLEQIKEQNLELKYLAASIDNQHHRYFETFEHQYLEKQKDILSLKKNVMDLENNIHTRANEYMKKDKQLQDLKSQSEKLEKINEGLQKENEEFTNKLEEIKEEKERYKILFENEKDRHEKVRILESEAKSQIETLKSYKEQSKKKDSEIKQLQACINEMKSRMSNEQDSTSDKNHSDSLLLKIREKDSMIFEMTKQINSLKTELLSCLNAEEKALKDNLERIEQLSKKEIIIKTLENKINNLERKYLALKNSKLGSFTLKYWRIRRKYSK
ncbi:methyltransferase domain-containing protein [Cytobacillus oceanisediminis]|uniref:methyltransferase domain-containing protein n=1 Tax=Cytobacillus oceanisediminis TaxID=665099 RepID=UPI001C2103D8|nr:methyltransferase domain-containing protein [Cytobacillus oceanisediminis]MBU8731720.1 methyltransferase domain-containing protein [Cytobacillus oceanisediminis]